MSGRSIILKRLAIIGGCLIVVGVILVPASIATPLRPVFFLIGTVSLMVGIHLATYEGYLRDLAAQQEDEEEPPMIFRSL